MSYSYNARPPPQYVQPGHYSYQRDLNSPSYYDESSHYDRHGSHDYDTYNDHSPFFDSSYEQVGSYAGNGRHFLPAIETSHVGLSHHQSNGRHGSFSQSPSSANSSGSNRHTSASSDSAGSARDTSPTSDDNICPFQDCKDPNGGPRRFSRKADVSRHLKSQHGSPVIDCPKHKCIRKGDNGFTRKDHCTEHLRQYHGESIPKRREGKGGSKTRHAN